MDCRQSIEGDIVPDPEGPEGLASATVDCSEGSKQGISEIADKVDEIDKETEKLKIDDGEYQEENQPEPELAVMDRYLSLAVSEKDKKRVSALLKDEQISKFLVLSLMHTSNKVVSATMDVFEVLLSTRKNLPVLKELSYFLPALELISKSKHKYNEIIRADAANMLRVLGTPDAKQPLGAQSTSMKNAENVPKGSNAKTSTLTRAKQRGRETVLLVAPGIIQQNQNRAIIERTLIKVKGIISLTFNLQKHLCIVRGKHNVDPEVFGVAIANLGFSVSLVSRNELQEEVIIPILRSPDENNEISKENYPDYLPEEDYDSSQVGDNAVCKPSAPSDNKQGSMFNSAINFVRSSFYW